MAAIEASLAKLSTHPDRKAQITSLFTENSTIPDEFSDFVNVFLKKKVLVLPEQTQLNEHAIKLENDKQLPYGSIYIFGPVELKTLEVYIKTHLKTEFIWSLKSPASTLVLFDKKPDRFCVGLNNLTIKNQ